MAGGDDLRLPVSLLWLRTIAEGRRWIDALPGLVAAACSRWSLRVGAPYAGSNVSLVLPAERDGDPAMVLKLQYRDRESEHESAALRAWDGAGAIRLVDDAPHLGALLLERCVPGTSLADAGAGVALEVLTGLLPRLAIPQVGPCLPRSDGPLGPFASLGDEAQRWAEHLPRRWEAAGQPFEQALVDRALRLLEALAGNQGPQVLVHQDLHGHNVLRAQREPWLAIDPKPLVGEIEFALAPIVRSSELGHSREAVLHRLDHLSAAMQVDRSRARDWCFAQTVAWSIDGGTALDTHLDTARWLLTA